MEVESTPTSASKEQQSGDGGWGFDVSMEQLTQEYQQAKRDSNDPGKG